jgi:hypothetical protein
MFYPRGTITITRNQIRLGRLYVGPAQLVQAAGQSAGISVNVNNQDNTQWVRTFIDDNRIEFAQTPAPDLSMQAITYDDYAPGGSCNARALVKNNKVLTAGVLARDGIRLGGTPFKDPITNVDMITTAPNVEVKITKRNFKGFKARRADLYVAQGAKEGVRVQYD